MGTFFEDLEDHEGYAARRLLDGSVTSGWTPVTAEFRSYVAACGCGWTGTDHPPTEEGRVRAEMAWELDHAHSLLRRAVPHGVAQAVAEARREVAELPRNRPVAAMAVLRDLGTWADCVTKIATACAKEQGEQIDAPGFAGRRYSPGRGGPAIGL